MSASTLLSEIDSDGRALVTLNRPEVHNAFDDALVVRLINELRQLEASDRVRVVLLTGSGRTFCAGADLAWMSRTAGYGQAENLADALGLAELMQTLDRLAKPTIALVQGPAYGGGVGLVACCDLAVAAPAARFRFSEVRLGLVPAVISPYVVTAIGARAARRYFLTGERFTAAEALRLGLVHEVVVADQLQRAAERMLGALLEGGPRAQAEAKRLVADVTNKPLEPALLDETAKRIASVRASAEGREGITAFLEKRKPNWVK
ncbi:MAG TPA: enoyl-CoA hydratase/isomerase family protein [Gaiellaceae bacterium]